MAFFPLYPLLTQWLPFYGKVLLSILLKSLAACILKVLLNQLF